MYNLNYDGYWREPNISGIPEESGVYSVYSCQYNNPNKTVSIRKLIYIGESQNVNDRISDHEKWEDWQAHLNYGEELCFNFAPISASGGRERVEAALIFHHKPPENKEYVNSFPYPETTVSTAGENSHLSSRFTVP